MATCRDFRAWFQTAEPGESAPEEIRGHRETCLECRDLERAYRRAVEYLRSTSTQPVRARPDLAAIRAALRGETRIRIRWWAWAVPAAAALLWFLWPTVFGPEGPRPEEGATQVSAPVPERVAAGRVEVMVGQVVQTEESAITLSDARIGTIRLSPRTRLRVSAWDAARTVLFLEEGEIEAAVVHRTPDRAFEVRTPHAVVRSIGTRFWVSHRPEAGTTVICLEGRVAVEDASGREVARLDAGRSLTTDARGAPLAGPDVALAGRPAPPDEGSIRAAAIPVRTARGTPGERPRATDDLGPPQPSRGPSLEEVLAHARDLVARDRGEEAAAYLTSLPDASLSRHARVQALLGDVFQTLGRPERAREAYERALATSSPAQAEGVLADLAGLLKNRLADPEGARRVWKRYLDTYPDGRYRLEALFELADLARAAGRPDDERDLLNRLIVCDPGSPLAVRALVQVGRELVESGRLEEAATWYEQHVGRGTGDLSEAALVGLMRVRAQQGRVSDVLARAREYERRFPDGRRAGEVKTLLDGIGAAER